jgi:alpha-L-rhamnosidase
MKGRLAVVGCAIMASLLGARRLDAQPVWIAPAAAAARPAPAWVWVGKPAAVCWLFKEFETGGGEATLYVAADNAATVFLNGREVLRTAEWRQPASARVTLEKGANRIAVRAENSGGVPVPVTNPAGVIVALRGDGDAAGDLVSDGSWYASSKEWSGLHGKPPVETSKAVVLGGVEARPWGLAAAAFRAAEPCPILRREFDVSGRVRSARVRVIGLGHYELRCNGRVVGDGLINQPWSAYDKTLYWQEFDLAPYLVDGSNALGVTLGNSFWWVGPPGPGRFAKLDAMPDFSRGEGGAAGRDHLLWLDGSVETESGSATISSDAEWKWSPGPLTFSHVYGGEDFDARRSPAGWDRAGFAAESWKPVEVVTAPAGVPRAWTGPEIRAFQVFAPREIRNPAPGIYTYVFPQNCSALLRYTLRGPAGSRVRFKPCEYMEPSGRVKFTYTWGTGNEIWQDYTLRGGADGESHQTLFGYEGAQYVQVEGAVPRGAPNPEGLPEIENLELVHVRAACPEVGSFECSSDLQNKAHRMIDWSIRSNMSWFPTDCPHREKNSWIEQDWHMARALSYRYDVRDWYGMLCRDLRDAQLPDGHIPTNSPNYLIGVPPHGFWNEAPEWGIAGVLAPWHEYEWYGDKRVLQESYESMRRYVEYLASRAKDGIITSNLGDWYDYGHGKGNGPSQWTPSGVTATAVWAMGARTVADAAAVLGKEEDAAKYGAMRAQIGCDFLRRFYDSSTKSVSNNGSCQAAHATALCAGLIPEADRAAALQAIVDDLEKRGYQQTVGEVTQVFFLRALAEGGRGDVLHRVYAREERGGYGFMVKSGLTTLPESWSAEPGTGDSMNHFMLGHLVEWHFAYVAGLRQPAGSIGWEHVLIQPTPGPQQGVTSARASFRSPRGLIESEWSIDREDFRLRVAIPEGSDARVVLPDGSEREVGAGEYRFTCAFP